MESKSARPIILITGSTGLIGTRVMKAFSSDFEVVGLDLKRPETTVPGTHFVDCDLTNDESVNRALDVVRDNHGDRLASVIHLAAYYDFSGKPSDMYRKLTVEGTFRLLRKLREFQTEQFVFSSSLLVMEPVEDEKVITEFSALEDEPWDYPRSKIEAEKLIRQERGDISTVILRIAGVYDGDCHSIPLAQHISRIYEKTLESYFFPGDSDHGQPFIHLDDLIPCFMRVVELRSALKNEIFLIAEPDVMSYAELQDQLGELIHGKEWPTIRIPKVIAKAGAWAQEKIAGDEETFIKPWMVDLADAHYPVAIGHAGERLGWNPTHRLRDTLPEMISRLKENPRKWYEINGLPWPEDKDEEKSKASSKASA